jgi:hypothetical protein
MRVATVEDLDVEINQRMKGKRTEKFFDESEVELVPDMGDGLWPAIVEKGASAHIKSDPDESLIHRKMSGTISKNSAFFPEGCGKGLPEDDARVLHGVVKIDLNVTDCFYGEVESTMLCEKREHVIEKRHLGTDGGDTGTVEMEVQIDHGLAGFAVDGALSCFRHGKMRFGDDFPRGNIYLQAPVLNRLLKLFPSDDEFPAMKLPVISEFAQYRFVRDRRGNVISLPSYGIDERILLVLDCERWGLARLHIFEGAAARTDKLEAFQEELARIAAFRNDCVSRLISWGRDSEELFYADEMRDGEPLPGYLGRTGGVPFSVAAEWVLGFLEFFQSLDVLPTSMERFTTVNFKVVMNRHGKIYPVFSEFYGWTKPGAQVREHRTEWNFAQIFCSLIAGVPVRTFHRDSLPRNFEELEEVARNGIVKTLDESGESTLEEFVAILKTISSTAADHQAALAVPQMPVREWLRTDLAASYDGAPPDYTLDAGFERGGECYAIPTRIRGKSTQIQLMPGPGSIPREGWLNQHHDATRRPGRGMMNQLQVSYIEDRESITLIGEERVDGIDLDSLLFQTGPFREAVVRSMAASIHSALDALERQAGACAVWWLPLENIFLITGAESLSGSIGFLERKGDASWSSLPLKLRLHQTVTTLKRAVNLPSRVRQLSRLPGKQFEVVRRSAIALPLLYSLITGTRFRWSRSVSLPEEYPAPVVDLLEKYRVALREHPEEIEENLFSEFERVLLCPVIVPLPEEEVSVIPQEDAGLEEALKASLYEGEIIVPRPLIEAALVPSHDPVASEDTPPEETDETEETEETDETDETEETEETDAVLGVPQRKRRPIFPVIVSGVVLALVVGYFLSGWNFRQGLFRSASSPEFPLVGFRWDDGDPVDLAKRTLEDFLIEDGSPDALGFLPRLNALGDKNTRDQVDSWLAARSAEGIGSADRVLGLLARSSGESSEVVAAHFLAGAKKRDPQSSFRLALFQWNNGSEKSQLGEVQPYLEEAASGGDPPSQELLALVKEAAGDHAGAYRWMDAAAKQGVASALYQMGLFYARGIGCERKPETAAKYFRTAAEQGDERAMFDYGQCLSEGYGVPTSYPEALRWMKIASSCGHGGALRWCLDRGIEVSEGVGE